MPGPMPQKTDEELRRDRLRFYREEMSEINATLRGFLSRAKASAAFLVDKDGHLITKEGADDRMDIDALDHRGEIGGRHVERVLGPCGDPEQRRSQQLPDVGEGAFSGPDRDLHAAVGGHRHGIAGLVKLELNKPRQMTLVCVVRKPL